MIEIVAITEHTEDSISLRGICVYFGYRNTFLVEEDDIEFEEYV